MDKHDRKEKVRAYKEKKPQAGVFCVRNLTNGKLWVSSNLNLEGVFNRTRFLLEQGVFEVPGLMADWKALGPEQFAFEVLDVLKPKDPPQADLWKELKVLEAIWLEKIQPYGEKGYNPQ